MAAGVVYFIQQGYDNIFKIGRTDGSSSARLKELQTGNPVRLRIFGEINCNGNSSALESSLHKSLDPYRLEGEWFFVNPARIVDTIKENSGSIFADDPLCVGFVKGDVKKIVIEKHTGIKELEFKTAKAIAIKKKRRTQCILSTMLAVPFSIVMAVVFSGIIFGFYSNIRNAAGFEYSHVFWSLFKYSTPLIYVVIFCSQISSDLKNDEVPDADVLFEYDKIKSK